MKYEEFKAKIKKLGVEINPYTPFDFDINLSKTGKIKKDFIMVWNCVGGVSGGSFWEDSDLQEYTESVSNKDREFSDLNVLLNGVSAFITYLDYKHIDSRLVIDGETTHYEYYGNRDDYEYRYLFLEELYNWLSEKNYITK